MSRLLLVSVSFLTFLSAIRADDDSTLCDFTAVIDVANKYYPGCRDLYNVLEQKLRSMDLGDCIVFGTTTLTSDILDQCKDDDIASEVVMAIILIVVVMAFIPVAIYHYLFWRQKKAAAQLDLANGKLGINDGPYKKINLARTRV
ncbi:hypothetical protein JM18_002110 [Phytophthora kernoviae]|uniref:Elicitin-like protein n=2 Tax=Phytophthora kernoviae TaxID=325452 RepID=A0A8T0M6F5_9STRA|nr:hypothetical protein G195_002692 [Phytophthora kernoviae 00238/432]KAG2528664.1 hypothetical protein JM16_002581 [Phytophthora kernoviae]KAG2530501.1 hypothetical protein JM18_002110 [Phytophthora kernoviae]